MRDPGSLYDLSIDGSAVPRGLHLVAGLTGFSDAGSAVTQFSQYLLLWRLRRRMEPHLLQHIAILHHTCMHFGGAYVYT